MVSIISYCWLNNPFEHWQGVIQSFFFPIFAKLHQGSATISQDTKIAGQFSDRHISFGINTTCLPSILISYLGSFEVGIDIFSYLSNVCLLNYPTRVLLAVYTRDWTHDIQGKQDLIFIFVPSDMTSKCSAFISLLSFASFLITFRKTLFRLPPESISQRRH